MQFYLIRALLVLVCGAMLLTPSPVDARDTVDTTATFYHPSLHGLQMANGVAYDRSNPIIAASNWYPLDTLLKVTRQGTAEHIYVRVQDRGARTLTLDLSEAGFTQLGRLHEGRIPVRVEIVRAGDDEQTAFAVAVRSSRALPRWLEPLWLEPREVGPGALRALSLRETSGVTGSGLDRQSQSSQARQD